jgi:hypothetical protein
VVMKNISREISSPPRWFLLQCSSIAHPLLSQLCIPKATLHSSQACRIDGIIFDVKRRLSSLESQNSTGYRVYWRQIMYHVTSEMRQKTVDDREDSSRDISDNNMDVSRMVCLPRPRTCGTSIHLTYSSTDAGVVGDEWLRLYAACHGEHWVLRIDAYVQWSNCSWRIWRRVHEVR